MMPALTDGGPRGPGSWSGRASSRGCRRGPYCASSPAGGGRTAAGGSFHAVCRPACGRWSAAARRRTRSCAPRAAAP
eukprot:10501056-Alexandrium_andersonii.AAC.2